MRTPQGRKEGRNARRKEGRKEGREEGGKEGGKEKKRKQERKQGRRKEGETKEARKEGRKIKRKERRTPTPSTLIQVIRIIRLLIIIIIVRPHNTVTVSRDGKMPKALRKVASSIFAPAKTEPIWTLSEPVIKVFANWGGCAPPTPPLFFDAMHAGFQKPRTRDKGVCKWGGLRPPPTPRFFNTMQAGFSRKKSHDQQELRQTCSCYGFFKSSYRQFVCK